MMGEKVMADNIFLIFGPSGSGKTSIVSEVLKQDEHLAKPVTYTTRPMRVGEKHGRDYYFLSEEEFEIDLDSFTEHSKYHGHRYGSKANDIWDYLYIGKDIIMILDINGIRAYFDWAIETQIIRPHVIFINAKDPIEQIMERARTTGETIEEVAGRIALMEQESILSQDPIVDSIIENIPGDMMVAVRNLLRFISLQRA